MLVSLMGMGSQDVSRVRVEVNEASDEYLLGKGTDEVID